MKPPKPSDNPKMKRIQRKKKTDTNERKITDMFQKQHQKPKTTTTVQLSREQTTTKTVQHQKRLIYITSASNGKIDRQDNNTEFTDLIFCDTTTKPGLAAKSESKLLLSIQLGSNSCDQKNQKGKRSKLSKPQPQLNTTPRQPQLMLGLI